AQFGEGLEGSQLVPPEIANRLVQADHAFLENVLVIGADEKIGTRLRLDKIFVLIDQILQRPGIPQPYTVHQFFVSHRSVVVVRDHFAGLKVNAHHHPSDPVCSKPHSNFIISESLQKRQISAYFFLLQRSSRCLSSSDSPSIPVFRGFGRSSASRLRFSRAASISLKSSREEIRYAPCPNTIRCSK